MFDFKDFTVCNNGDLKGYVVGVIHFENTDKEHDFLYRIYDPENGEANTIVSIDYGYENPLIAEQWEVIERTIYEKVQGYYECTCGEKYISSFPFNELRCNCGATVNRLKYVSDEQANELREEWFHNESSKSQ